ncbi:MAG: histidine kinase [Defluviitaleaceae bacterium]|nr:histidine kinase [Defluviitaleaceae bacterium]
MPFTKIFYISLVILGFCLLLIRWFLGGEMVGFFLLLFMVCMTLLRWRFNNLKLTVILDCVLCAVLYPIALPLALFSGLYYRIYFVLPLLIVFLPDFNYIAIAGACGISGLFLGLWEKERERALNLRDIEAGRYYKLESLQSDLLSASMQIERMTIVSERARIAREIHDNAGHEIVAAFISLQAVREEFANYDEDALQLYDAALERLDTGVEKIREAVHNLAPLSAIGVESLREICEKYPSDTIAFNSFGNTANVPIHVWNVMEACLQESLTNAAKHAKGKSVAVDFDVTPNIARLCIENDKSHNTVKIHGQGLKNLKHRVSSAGGNLSIDFGEKRDGKFRVVCVIPIKSIKEERI